MAQCLSVHPDNPQSRLLAQAADLLRQGAVLAIPTDSGYALACHLDDRQAVQRLRRIRQINDKHHLTLLCRDLSELASYARVNNNQYRLLKLATPGPYTFILEASKAVPKRLSHPARKTLGLRVPDRKDAQLLLQLLGEALLCTSFIPPQASEPLCDADAILQDFAHVLDAVVDAGTCPAQPTTVVDLTPMTLGQPPAVLRQGRGSLAAIGLGD